MNETDNKSDFLNKAGNKIPFTAPEGYFERFPARLQERMQQEEQTSWFSRTYRFVRPQLAMAAIIVGFVVLSYSAVRFILNDRADEPTINEIAYVLEDYLYDIEDDLLINTIIEEEIDVEWINGGYGSDDIMDYLMDEDIDYTNLINEYNIY